MRLGFDVLSVPHRSESAKVFVRLEGAVFVGNFFEFEADGGGSEVVAIIELLPEDVIGALDNAIVSWPRGRQGKEGQVQVGAGLLEFTHELGSAFDLDGSDLE